MQNTIILTVLLAISILLIFQMLLTNRRLYTPTVKAGKMKDFEWKYFWGAPRVPEKIVFAGKPYKSNDYDIKVIRGESMQLYGLHDKYIAFIHAFTTEEKSNISGYPIVELDIFYTHFPKFHARFDSDTKLRKFIAYIKKGENDWENVYEQYSERIHLDRKEDFKTDFEKGIKRLRNCEEMLILSETYDTKTKRNHYSLHPISTLRGQVEFYFPMSKVAA